MRIAIVGGCATGKSTIALELNSRGFDAYIVGQEHSEVSYLWSRQNPDAVVYLQASIEAVRARRGQDWPQWLHARQRERLADARDHADVVVDTSDESASESVLRIINALERRVGDASDG